ncbi:hypothetical protein K438DRAFT_1105548 [Mycena galopus ATCC 62051]|nr:hypothetical protein K438DRAFT_1105548 [Mycena galopus ATCC 62051]
MSSDHRNCVSSASEAPILLGRICSSWRAISLSTPVSFLVTDMPMLESVSFDPKHDHALEDFDCGHFNILRNAQISSLSVSRSVFMPENFPLAWKKLTTNRRTHPVVSTCSELRCCKLTIHDAVNETPTRSYPVAELPFLHTLAIRCAANAAPAVSVLLPLPELRSFTFIGHAGLADSPPLADFLANVFHLESLTIDTQLFTKHALLKLSVVCRLQCSGSKFRLLGVHQ